MNPGKGSGRKRRLQTIEHRSSTMRRFTCMQVKTPLFVNFLQGIIFKIKERKTGGRFL